VVAPGGRAPILHALARVARAVRDAPPRAIVALGWLVVFVFAYPGQMSAASFAYLRQARTPYLNDANPPGMSALWRLTELLVAGPTGMLLVQSAMFLAGAYLILRRVLAARPAAWTLVALAVFPPVLVGLSSIWSQSMMASFLVLGAGALWSERRRVRLAGLAALFGATFVQPSALVATLPLIWFGLAGCGRRDWFRNGLRALAVWMVISTSALAGATLFAKQRTWWWHSTLAAHDLTGTLAFIGPELDRVELPLTVREASSWQLPEDGAAPPLARREALARAARALAFGHPSAYLRHRLSVFRDLLWLDERHVETAVISRDPRPSEDAAKLGIPTRASRVQRTQASWLTEVARHTPLLVPWVYVALAVVLLPLARHHRDVIALLASGLAFQTSLLVTATGPAYCQSFWMIASTCVAIVMLAIRRART
jgi:hypothetical protein